MGEYVRTLGWGCVGIVLFAAVAMIVFCYVTDGIFQSDACDLVMDRLVAVARLFEP